MSRAHFETASKSSVQILLAAAALALPFMRLQAQPAVVESGLAGYEVACTIEDSSGSRICEQAPVRSCNADAEYASQPSQEPTDMTWVNRGDQPVKVYWLNFRGERVLYLSLPPGGRRTQRTFVGHNWLVTTATELCLGIFETAPPPVVADGSVSVAPPPIPVYDQPPPPEEDVVWTPGYWAWSEGAGDYYWVPGTWVTAPIVGYLWTPGYWIARHGTFVWAPGYWGPHVGFYGGIYYGHGYFGRGFVGGSWRDGRMMYNSAVTNVANFHSANIYSQPAVNNGSITQVSYAGGGGGSNARPNSAELAAAAEYHIPPTAGQRQQLHAASEKPAMRQSANNGHPSIGATARPGELSGTSMAPAHHAGTLSVMHSTPEPHPAAADTAPPPHAARALSASPVDHAQIQPRTPQSPAHVAQSPAPAEPQAAAQERAQPHPNPSQTRPRPAPHTEGHPP